MSIVVESDDAVFISSLARLVDDDRDVASDWAGKHIKTNKFIKWVIGRYVEADNANRNGQYWTLRDLQLKHDTVHHTPMNMGHRQHDVVGTVVASEMIYPSDEGNPYVETVGAFWKYYFPNELEQLKQPINLETCGRAWKLFLTQSPVWGRVLAERASSTKGR